MAQRLSERAYPANQARGLIRVVAATLALLPASAAAEGLVIDHQRVACVIAEKFARIQARFEPADAVSRARIYFRPEGGAAWYFVPMKADAGSFAGVLPKPKKSLKRFSYYVEALDRSFGASRTSEYWPAVVSGPGVCADKETAIALGSASVVVQGPAGAARIPPGFSSSGVVAAGTAAAASAGVAAGAGVAAAAGGGAAVGGGGIAAPLIGVAVGAAAAGGLAAIDPKVNVLPQNGGGGGPQQCGAPGLKLAVSVGPGPQPAINWTPPCSVVSILVETAADGGDLWSTDRTGLLPPVPYTGPALVGGTAYNVVLFDASENALGVLTFTR